MNVGPKKEKEQISLAAGLFEVLPNQRVVE
jgi:hypothetical protein